MTFGTSHCKRCIVISVTLSLHPLIQSPPENLCPEQLIRPNPYYIWTYNKPKPAAALISNQDSYKKIPVLPQKMDRQNSLSLSNVTGTGWCSGPFVLSGIWDHCLLRCWGGQALQGAWIRGEAGGCTFCTPCVRQCWILHSGGDNSFTIIRRLLGHGISQASNHPTHILRQLRVSCTSLHPFRCRKLLLLHFPCGQASRVCSLQFCCNPESILKLWWQWFSVIVCSTQECFGFLTSDKASSLAWEKDEGASQGWKGLFQIFLCHPCLFLSAL